LQSSDLVIIATEHSNVDYAFVVANARAVLDTRGVTRKLDVNHEKVTLL